LSGFDVSSTQYCLSCPMDVKIGLGGEANWEVHLKSLVHIWSEQASASQAVGPLT
ncbi:hypothetical protein L208DRAFT_1073090, partial [Tricholoma matsutake]